MITPAMYSATHLGKVQHIHFVGIGGVGMSGIAEVLLSHGYTVSGSDMNRSRVTAHLEAIGAKVYDTHLADHIVGADVLVYSSAISPDNPELIAAKERRLPVIPRAVMLGELMRFRQGIAVAGTHGKTTTTSIITHILAFHQLDPTFVIGGRLHGRQGHAQLGKGAYMVAEADESDASFLYLKPCYAVVTNIDDDHVETYQHDMAQLRLAFLQFLQQLPFYGLAVLCADHPLVMSLIPQLNCPVKTYGLHADADVRASDIKVQGLGSRFIVHRLERAPLDITLQLPGTHNVVNACAAITLAMELDIPDAVVQAALSAFQGVNRRLQLYGSFTWQGKSLTLVDDYGHHPNEIKAVLQALRAIWPKRRLVMVFQPHRYSRTKRLYEPFIQVLVEVDVLFLLDIYPAGEAPLVEVSSEQLAHAIKKRGQNTVTWVEDKENLLAQISLQLREDDILLTQGAGNIGAIAKQWATHFALAMPASARAVNHE